MRPQPRSRKRVLAAAALVFVAGSCFVIAGQRTERKAPESAQVNVVSGDGGATRGAGPAAAEAAPGDAATAAVVFATAAQAWLYLTDEQIRTAVEAIATPDAAAALTADVVVEVAMAREQLASSPGRVWWLVRPLAWKVESATETQARVSVWTITILSAVGVALPQSEYLTVTLDLEHIDGSWKVAGVRDLPGPTPDTGPKDQPWGADRFDDALEGFTRIGEEPQP